MVTALSAADFADLASAYRLRCGMPLYGVGRQGRLVHSSQAWPEADDIHAQEVRRFVLEESWRWGECGTSLCGQRLIVWGIALTQNNKVTGGLVSWTEDSRLLQPGNGHSVSGRVNVREAARTLRLLAEEQNLTNTAALAARRALYESEQQRAYVLHRDAGQHATAIRQLYSREEPELFAAIRAGNRREARRIVNRVLVAIYHHGGGDLGLLKGFLLELIASMSRAAVETGADPGRLFGGSFIALSELADVDSMEAMARWVRQTLEQLMEAVPAAGTGRSRERILKALHYMEQNSHRSLRLASAARVTGLSPSRFCAVLKEETGSTFSQLLNRMRVDHAAVLLRTSDCSIGEVALRSGFSEQSYFTRMFRRFRGCTPRQFRTSIRSGA